MAQYYIGSFSADSNTLYHHGIKGQKWGVRRFQNEDGSLTPDGVRRYQNSNAYFMTSKRRKDARKELGLEKSWIKRDSGERLITEVYARTKKAIDKTNKKNDKAKAENDTESYRKGKAAVKSLEKELKQLKLDFDKYEALPKSEKRKLTLGANVVSGLTTAGILALPASVPFGVAAAVVGAGNVGEAYFNTKMMNKLRTMR